MTSAEFWRRLAQRLMRGRVPATAPAEPPGTPEVERLLDGILRREGGYVDHPNDRGGPTKYGVTLRTLRAWRDRPTTAADVEALTEAEARSIYRVEYYEGPRIDQLPPELRGVVFDASVNHGPRQAVRMVQDVVGRLGQRPVVADGHIGPRTLAAVAAVPVAHIRAGYQAERRAYFRRIVARDPSQRVFLAGWLNRVDELDRA